MRVWRRIRNKFKRLVKNSVAAPGRVELLVWIFSVPALFALSNIFWMQIFYLPFTMKDDTISKDVNKAAVNFDLFGADHINIRDNKMVEDLSKTNIHLIQYMFLLSEMCSIQNHLFDASRFCARYVCEAKQTSLLWRSGSRPVSLRHNPRDDKVTKHVVPAFVTYSPFFIRWRLKKGSEHCFSRASKVFLRSSLVEWVVLATCQSIICYCLWDAFPFPSRCWRWIDI